MFLGEFLIYNWNISQRPSQAAFYILGGHSEASAHRHLTWAAVQLLVKEDSSGPL